MLLSIDSLLTDNMDPYKSRVSYTDSPISSAIICHFDTIVENLKRVEEVFLGMFSAHLITMDEKQHLVSEGNSKGNNAKVRLLLNYLLQKPEEVQKCFLEIVDDKGSQALASLIKHHVSEVQQGQMPKFVNDAKLKDYTGKLKSIYHDEKKWNTVEAVPGVVTVDLLQEGALIKPLFKVEIADTEAGIAGLVMHQSVKYKTTDIQKLEDVFPLSLQPVSSTRYFENKRMDINNKVIICTGNPGVGKTTLCKNLLMGWANGDARKKMEMLKFKLVFYIPVREVQDERIVNILDSFNLVDDNCRPFLHWVLTKYAHQILFLLDGVDEVELSRGSELWKLMENKIYDGCTVLLTSRPEAKILRELGFKPKVKIHLEGTDAEEAQMYIENYMKEMHNQDITKWVHLFKCKLGDSKLLQIPVYVVFLLFSISSNGENGWDAVPVPDTLTDVLSSFLVTLVKRWLDRLGRSTEMVKGSSSLLGRNSTVPMDIQRILFLLGKLCYESILSGKYEFCEADIKSFYLNIEDLKTSGLFTVSKRMNSCKLCVMHRIVHEYLAGMYIASEQFGISTFTKIIADSHCVSCLGEKRLLGAVQFAVGSCPTLLAKIIDTKYSSHSIVQSKSDGTTDIYYEASLLYEANTEDLYQRFFCLLMNAKTVHGQNISFAKQFLSEAVDSPTEEIPLFGSTRMYQKYLTKFVNESDVKMSASLLAKFYNVRLEDSPHDNFRFKLTNIGVVNIVCKLFQSNTLTIPLDQLSAELLGRLTVRDVQKLKVRSWNRAFLDLPCLMDALPDMRVIDIIAVPIDCNLKFCEPVKQFPNNNRIETISLFSAREPCVLSKDAVHAITNQKCLRSLILIFCDILSEFKTENIVMTSVLKDLEELILFDNQITGSKLTSLCSLTRSCRKLRKLTLWGVCIETVDIYPYIQQIRNYRNLEVLSIHLGPSQKIIQLAKVLPELPVLKTFSVHCQRIAFVEEELVRCLCKCNSVQTLTVWDYDGELKATGYHFPKNLQRDLQLHHIELKMKTPGMLATWEDFVQLYHDF